MINQTAPFFLSDLYNYDVHSCYPQILLGQNFNFNGIDLKNKDERNRFIGIQQIDNPELSDFLIQSAKKLIDYYIRRNGLNSETDIITTQRDGFISTKKLLYTNDFIEIQLREQIDFLIINSSRDAIMYCCDDLITVKYLSHMYDGILEQFQYFSKFNFYDTRILFIQMDMFRNRFLKETNLETFVIPKDDKFVVFLKNQKTMTTSNMDYIDIDQIDRLRYFNHYFRNFFRSMFLTFSLQRKL